MAQNAFDRRRINGPEESCPPVYESDEEAVGESSKGVTESSTRKGRTPKEIRPICVSLARLRSYSIDFDFALLQDLKTGLINQANGSAYIETERTKIACAVSVSPFQCCEPCLLLLECYSYGPRQSRSSTYNEKGKLNVEVKFAPFSCTQRRAPMRVSSVHAVQLTTY